MANINRTYKLDLLDVSPSDELETEVANIVNTWNNHDNGNQTWTNVKTTNLSSTNAPTFTSPLPIASGGTNSGTALNNNRFVVSSGGAIVEAAAVTASKAMASDANGLPTASSTTSTELGYIHALSAISATLGTITTADSMSSAFGKIINARIVQIVQGTTTTTTAINSNTTAATHITASITPQATGNKIIVFVSTSWRINGTDLTNGAQAFVKRGTTDISGGANFANIIPSVSAQSFDSSFSLCYLDSPAAVTSQTYTVWLASNNASNTINMPIGTQMGMILLVEIGA